jgi:hypothetical protein
MEATRLVKMQILKYRSEPQNLLSVFFDRYARTYQVAVAIG